MSNKVPVKEKIGYGCGEFAGSLIWQYGLFLDIRSTK